MYSYIPNIRIFLHSYIATFVNKTFLERETDGC
jgi:hypothetical protein